MNIPTAALLFALLIASGPIGAAEKADEVLDMQALRTSVRSDKKAFVASTLKLTPAEARKFWPLYDTYQRHIDASNQRRVVAVEGLIAHEQPLSDLYARTLANELILTDEAEVKARRTLHNRLFNRALPVVLPAKKAARYLQLENKIRAVQAYDIAANIPLIK